MCQQHVDIIFAEKKLEIHDLKKGLSDQRQTSYSFVARIKPQTRKQRQARRKK